MRETAVDSHPFRKVREKDGAPSITVSALSRDTSSAPVAILLPASVLVSGFAFPLVEGFGVAFVFGSFDQGSLLESCSGKLVPPSITVSALSRDTSSAPVAILLPASVLVSGFAFPLVEG